VLSDARSPAALQLLGYVSAAQRAAGMDVIAPLPLGSAGLAVDGTGGYSASAYPPITEPAQESERQPLGWDGKTNPGPP
jgi:hypothetical protein